MRPDILYPLFTGVDSLKGVGPQAFKRLKNMGLKTILDLLFHLPTEMINRRKPPYLTCAVKVLEHIKPYSTKAPYKIVCSYPGGLLDIVFFNYKKDYLIESLPEGAERFISGKVETFGNRLQMSHPDYITKDKSLIPLDEPVYPLTQGITNKMMENYARQALRILFPLPEWQSDETLRRQSWSSFENALKTLHNPTEMPSLLSKERLRLAYDELLAGQIALALVRHKIKKKAGVPMKTTGALRNELLKTLPFHLTGAQLRALGEIDADMAEPFRMIRLLQGDVGSGKTIVGLLAMLNALENGKQAALMAPTDILIRQHATTLSRFCRGIGIEPVLLTGREKGKRRQEILEEIASGKARIILGTHALFEPDVVFKDLGLAIIDEQHRFGVEQRLALTHKGKNTDILVMTATPIPRSLALTFYGDMDISKIDEKPANRQKVDTRVFSIKKEKEILEGLKKQVADGAQIFWVCPLIEETEKSDLASATARFECLKALFGTRVGLIHGKMKDAEKDTLMQAFIDKKLSVLVATTVIEVGVDVPDATVMVIEQAERFGLAQLHQLRGRIGRGEKKSVCLLIYNNFLSDIARKRLETMRATDDGFIIAEEDLKLRGAGDVLGVRQSGLQSFKIADLTVHSPFLSMARAEAVNILKNDPTLSSEKGQALRLLLFLFNKTEEMQTLSAG